MQLFPLLSDRNTHLTFSLYPKNFSSFPCNPAFSWHSSLSSSTQSHGPFSSSEGLWGLPFWLPVLSTMLFSLLEGLPSLSLFYRSNAKLSLDLTSSDRVVFSKDGHNKFYATCFSAMRSCYSSVQNWLYFSTPLNLGRICDILINRVWQKWCCAHLRYSPYLAW